MKNEELLSRIAEGAHNDHIPIINKEAADLLKILIISKKPMRVLEIGTAAGYSAIAMMSSLPADACIDTIENDYDMLVKARENIREAGYADRIRLIYGNAPEVMKDIEGKYDLIFIDAAKGQYNEYLKLARDLLARDALLIADNVLYRGMVNDAGFDRKKTRTMIRTLRRFKDTIMNDRSFISVILKTGDGISVSVYTGGENER